MWVSSAWPDTLELVAPDQLHENLPSYRLGFRAVEILQDRRLLLGKSGAPVRHRVLQRLGGGAEYVGSDREGGIRGFVEYPQLGAQPREQFVEPERLGDVVAGPRLQAPDDVFLGIQAGQHDDGYLVAFPSENVAEIAAVAIRHSDVEDHCVDAGALRVDGRISRIERRRGGYRKSRLNCELLHQRLSQRRVVIHDEYRSLPQHCFRPRPRLSPRAMTLLGRGYSGWDGYFAATEQIGGWPPA